RTAVPLGPDLFSALQTKAELGGDRRLVAPVLERAADQRLVRPRTIHLRRIEERAAEVDGAMESGDRFRLVRGPIGLAHPHAAEADGGDLEALAAEFASTQGHGVSPLLRHSLRRREKSTNADRARISTAGQERWTGSAQSSLRSTKNSLHIPSSAQKISLLRGAGKFLAEPLNCTSFRRIDRPYWRKCAKIPCKIPASREFLLLPAWNPSGEILHLEQFADLDGRGAGHRVGAAFDPVDRLVEVLDVPDPVAGGEFADVFERTLSHAAVDPGEGDA